jgi:hypothetical protein
MSAGDRVPNSSSSSLENFMFFLFYVIGVISFQKQTEHDFFEEHFNLINLRKIKCISKLFFFCSGGMDVL